MLDVRPLVLDFVSVALQLCVLLVIVQLSVLKIGLDGDVRAANATGSVLSGDAVLGNITGVVQGVVQGLENATQGA
tara:strand:+ start:509 stop:736 length:228 start_codon:yes stop_codon:yes gene_type:complete